MPIRQRAARILLRGLGVALVALVVWLVGWQDRVRTEDGGEHRGRILRVDDNAVVLRENGVERTLPIRSPADARRGLGGAFASAAAAPGWIALAALGLIASMVLIQWRWAVHLRGADLVLPFREVARLGWIGMFFNQVLPAGQVGGDLVKAVLIARRQPGRRTMAVVSVLADRGTGLFVLTLVATVAVLFAPRGSRIDVARAIVLGFFAICVVFLGLLMLPRLRGPLRIGALLRRLPLARLWIDVARAFVVYGERPRVVARGVAVGLLVHAFWLLTFWALGAALGVRLSALAVFVVIPVAMMAGAIPGLPGGWGYGDMAFFFFLPVAGVPAATAVALSFLFRALMMLISLPGGVMLARGAGEREAAAGPLY